MRILIDTERRENPAYSLPWNSTATFFNFNAPTRTVSPKTKFRNPKKVETLVINCELPDYRFISKMHNLEQLYIFNGGNLEDLSFLRSLTKLRQLCLVGTNVESLEALLSLIKSKQEIYEKEAKKSSYEETRARFTYGFEGLYFESKKYKGDGTELLEDSAITRKDIWINGKCITAYQMHFQICVIRVSEYTEENDEIF